MKLTQEKLISKAAFILAIVPVIVCVTLSVLTIEKYAKDECFRHIEETTTQVSDMFSHAILQSRNQLELFADILAANSSNPEELLQVYMENFCDTQSFSAVCLHRWDGWSASYGDHPAHPLSNNGSFATEAAKVPYISDVLSVGETRSEQYVYLAVPVVRAGQTQAVLYGYISLDTFPAFVSSAAYGGACQFYIVDGNTGQFLMDEYHRYGKDGQEIPLSNMFDGSMGDRISKPGYDIQDMRQGVSSGKSGYYVFESQRTGEWYYTYYTPIGINNWSMQITIDEPTAFKAYHDVRSTVFILMACVVLLSLFIIAVLIYQNHKRRKQDIADLHRADYLNAVQSALITAHNDPDFVDQALKIMAREVQAETVLLLTLSHNQIGSAYFWPSEDKLHALALVGLNVQDVFPVMFDALASKESIFYNEQFVAGETSPAAKKILVGFDVRNLMLVPIADNSGILKGAIAAINLAGGNSSPELLECVTRDFFMAITNLENHNIIKKMGMIDYLTGVKNRNSFEAETGNYETLKAESLWCAFVDVNGLHELNNTKGHKAGDAMLCAVADAVKKVFGPEFTYRLGGDEFVAFRANSSHEECMNCKYRLLSELERKGYAVSVGFEGITKNENNIFDVEKVMADAEAIMYREKWKYYQRTGISPQRNHPPIPPQQD